MVWLPELLLRSRMQVNRFTRARFASEWFRDQSLAWQQPQPIGMETDESGSCSSALFRIPSKQRDPSSLHNSEGRLVGSPDA